MASATATDLGAPSQNAPQAADTSTSTQFPQVNIGTRNSALAQIQARAVAAALKKAHPERTYNICPVVVEGDRDKITPLQQLSQGENAKSLWTGELESMLEKGDLDIIVHCLKGTSSSGLHVLCHLIVL
jgi:hydroxymethylbilane synthase